MTAPQPADGPAKVLRGGAWANYGTDWVRPAHHIEIETVYSKPSVGFRTFLNAQHPRESH